MLGYVEVKDKDLLNRVAKYTTENKGHSLNESFLQVVYTYETPDWEDCCCRVFPNWNYCPECGEELTEYYKLKGDTPEELNDAIKDYGIKRPVSDYFDEIVLVSGDILEEMGESIV